jgi:hypothetical protein
MKAVLVYGSSTFGRVVRALVNDCGRKFAGFIDDWSSGGDVIGDINTLLSGSLGADFDLAMAIGYRHLDARLALYRRLRAAGHHFGMRRRGFDGDGPSGS